MWFYTRQMLAAALVTLELAGIGTGVSLLLGVLGGLGRVHGPRVLRWLIVAYVELVRGTPAILQLFILYFGLTQFGIDMSPMLAVTVWLCFYGTGYAIEIFRAGLVGVAHGQREAAAALALGRGVTMRRVILPQAVAAMLPALTSFVVIQIKNTTIGYIVGASEVMYHARIAATNTNEPLAVYAIAGGIYIVLNGLVSRGAAYMRHRQAWTDAR